MWSEPEAAPGGGARAAPADPPAPPPPAGAPPRWKDLVLSLLALPWELAFGAVGLLARRPPGRWSSPSGLRVLVVAPHPDDEVAGCGGTLLLHRDRGDEVTVAVVTDGRRSRALGLAPEEMAIRRRGEAGEAATLLDVELAWMGLPEGEWREEPCVAELARLLEAEAPHVLYAPSRVDFHPEHRRVAQALARALGRWSSRRAPETERGGAAGPRPPGTAEREGRAPLVRVFELHVPLTSVLVDRVAETAGVATRSGAALAAHRSQRGSLARVRRRNRYNGRRYRAGPEAEVFWELSAPAYVALHAVGDPDRWPAPFRGVRRFPWADPLSWLRGRAERRRLRSVARGSRGDGGSA